MRSKSKSKSNDDENVVRVVKQKRLNNLQIINALSIEKYNLYWVKMRGYTSWPAIVEEVFGNRFNIHFFGDYTKASVYRNSILHSFSDGFNIYKDANKVNMNLNKAVTEASLHFSRINNTKQKSCCICDFLINKI